MLDYFTVVECCTVDLVPATASLGTTEMSHRRCQSVPTVLLRTSPLSPDIIVTYTSQSFLLHDLDLWEYCDTFQDLTTFFGGGCFVKLMYNFILSSVIHYAAWVNLDEATLVQLTIHWMGYITRIPKLVFFSLCFVVHLSYFSCELLWFDFFLIFCVTMCFVICICNIQISILLCRRMSFDWWGFFFSSIGKWLADLFLRLV